MSRQRFVLCIAIIGIVCGAFFVAWLNMVRMPGKPFRGLAEPLSPQQTVLRDELAAHVQKLAGEIGERNELHYTELNAAAEYIERIFTEANLRTRRDSYKMRGRNYHNLEAEIRGAGPEVVLIGAHYDSVVGSPGANDNGSGVAALLALAKRFAGRPCKKTLRFLAFVNEEPPYFQSPQMGSFVYAQRCKEQGAQIGAMISLETIGYFSEKPSSQTYPLPGLGLFYPTKGNFIGFVGNVQSGSLVRKAIRIFRQHAQIPCEGAALPASIPGIGWSDQWSFWQHGYPGMMITDTAPFRYPDYHADSDTPDKLDYASMARVVEGMEKVVEHLAN